MNSRFAFLASSFVMAVISLALSITFAEATASSMSDEAIGVEAVDGAREVANNRLFDYQR